MYVIIPARVVRSVILTKIVKIIYREIRPLSLRTLIIHAMLSLFDLVV